MKALLAAACFLCATPDTVTPFRDTGYEEHLADQGVVNLACYNKGGKLDDGKPKHWNDSYCGCVDFIDERVWISRNRFDCGPIEAVRDHEECHIRTGPDEDARLKCAEEYM